MENTEKKTAKRKKRGAVPFDDSAERLDRIIQRLADEEDYFGALRFMNRRNENFCEDVDSYAAQAELYEQLGVHSRAVRMWFSFLNEAEEEDFPEAYEGLMTNYMDLGNEAVAKYYFFCLRRQEGEDGDGSGVLGEYREEIEDVFTQAQRKSVHIVYPPEKADYSDTVNKGMGALARDDYRTAYELFDSVPRGSKQYASARSMKIVACALGTDSSRALSLCEETVEAGEADVLVYSLYASILVRTGEDARAREIAVTLCGMEPANSEELYKIAVVCCECGLHSEALTRLNRLEETVGYDKDVLFYKAMAEFNTGNVDLCVETFEKLLTLYPAAAVSRYYYDFARYFRDEYGSDGDTSQCPMPYRYEVNESVREAYVELLRSMRKTSASYGDEFADSAVTKAALQWCFDEMGGNDRELQLLAMEVAVHFDYDKFIQDMLLEPNVDNYVKVKTVELIAGRNRETEYGVVLSNIYRRVRFFRIHVGVKRRKKFMNAYASVYARYVYPSEDHGRRISAAGELLYQSLVYTGKEALIDREADTGCAIAVLAGIKEAGADAASICLTFGADPVTVSELLGAVEEARNLAGKEKAEPAGKAGGDD